MDEQLVTDYNQAYAEAYAANDIFDRTRIANEALALRQEALRSGEHPNTAAERYYVAAAREIAKHALATGDFSKLDLYDEHPNMPGNNRVIVLQRDTVALSMYVVRAIEFRNVDSLTPTRRDRILRQKPISVHDRQEAMDQASNVAARLYKHGLAVAKRMHDSSDEQIAADRLWDE